MVGLVVPDITNPFFVDIAQSAGGVAHALGCGVVLCSTEVDPDLERSQLRLLRRKRVDGFLFTAVTADDPHLDDLAQAVIPFALVSRFVRGVDAPFVVVDDRQGGA